METHVRVTVLAKVSLRQCELCLSNGSRGFHAAYDVLGIRVCKKHIAKVIDAASKRACLTTNTTAESDRHVRGVVTHFDQIGKNRGRTLRRNLCLALQTIEEFLPVLHASEVKLELVDGQIVPFAGGTIAHRLICDRIVHALSSAVKPGCEVFTSDVALRHADAPTYVFPDASYTYETLDPDAGSIVAPSLIVEVMSAQSVERDRVDKLNSYQVIASVQEYLIVDSRRRWACVYRRSGPTWFYTIYGLNDTLELFSTGGTQIKMDELYAGIETVALAGEEFTAF